MSFQVPNRANSLVPSPANLDTFFVRVRDRMRASRVFATVEIEDGVMAAALGSAAPAHYSVRCEVETGAIWVALEMADRWLSESIESQLVEFGDSMEELLEDELVELGYVEAGGTAITKVEHYRSDERLFVFRARVGVSPEPVDSPRNVEIVTCAVLAFEACFRQLGDMQGSEES